MKQILISALLATCCLSRLQAAPSVQEKNDTLVVTTQPQMHCENCEKRIKQNIRFVKGVKRIDTSVPRQQVTIVYNSEKSSYADFEKAFSRIGYKIERKSPAR